MASPKHPLLNQQTNRSEHRTKALREHSIQAVSNQPPGWSLVGKVREAHGLKGELFLVLFAKTADWIDRLEEVGLEVKRVSPGSTSDPAGPVLISEFNIFKVKRRKAHKVGVIVQLDGLSSRTEAEPYVGALVSISQKLLISAQGERIFLGEISGFEINDAASGKSGVVTGFATNGAQDLLEVRIGTDTHLVPFVPQFLIRILWEDRKIEMRLPDGLLEAP